MIRKANSHDYQDVFPLWEAANGDILLTQMDTEDMQVAKERLEVFYRLPDNRFSKDNVIVWEEAGKVAGLLFCYGGGEAKALTVPVETALRSQGLCPSIRIECRTDEFYFDSVAIFEQFRGQGGLRLLFDAGLKAAQTAGYHRAGLLVDERKPKTKAMYEHLGFEAVEQFESYGHQFFRMVKKL